MKDSLYLASKFNIIKLLLNFPVYYFKLTIFFEFLSRKTTRFPVTECAKTNTAIYKKVVGKKCTLQSRRVLWVVLISRFLGFSISRESEKRARDTMDVCFRVLKESAKVDSTVQCQERIFGDCVYFLPSTFLQIAVKYIFSRQMEVIIYVTRHFEGYFKPS